MRVISGSARGRRLMTPRGMKVRPTTDRIKETLFNILAPRIYDVEMLDLFAGSGGIGIEALSRGAKTCYFVDKDKDSLACIRENLKLVGFEDKSFVIPYDVMNALSSLGAKKAAFDIIFIDPPYRMGLEKEALTLISRYGLLKDDGLIIVESSVETPFDYLEDIGLTCVRNKEYGSNKHIFIEKSETESEK